MLLQSGAEQIPFLRVHYHINENHRHPSRKRIMVLVVEVQNFSHGRQGTYFAEIVNNNGSFRPSGLYIFKDNLNVG